MDSEERDKSLDESSGSNSSKKAESEGKKSKIKSPSIPNRKNSASEMNQEPQIELEMVGQKSLKKNKSKNSD